MFIIRTDGNTHIGVGHLMRCLTIVSVLTEKYVSKHEVLFICADEMSAGLVRENGYHVFVCATDYRCMEEELPVLHNLIHSLQGSHTFLVDSYYITNEYLIQLRKYGKVILLDDMQQKKFEADAVINYNVFAEECVYKQLYNGTNTRYYIGASLVPVRQQFVNVKYQLQNKVSRVMITTGGGDQYNIAGQILEEIYDEKIFYHIITGRFNPHLEHLKSLEQRGNVKIDYDVKDMASVMAACDLAITAGGTTIYELAAIGIPFICFSYAENQEALTEYIGVHDIAGYAGAFHKKPQQTLQYIGELFQNICADRYVRNEYCSREKCMIDGMGAHRIAGILSGKELL